MEATGIIESFNGDWRRPCYEKANEYGIYDVDDLKKLVRWAVKIKSRSLATEMWSSISPNAKSRINKTNGVTLNEADAKAAWFLGLTSKQGPKMYDR